MVPLNRTHIAPRRENEEERTGSIQLPKGRQPGRSPERRGCGNGRRGAPKAGRTQARRKSVRTNPSTKTRSSDGKIEEVERNTDYSAPPCPIGFVISIDLPSHTVLLSRTSPLPFRPSVPWLALARALSTSFIAAHLPPGSGSSAFPRPPPQSTRLALHLSTAVLA